MRTIDTAFKGILNKNSISAVNKVWSIQSRTLPPGQFIVVNSKLQNWEEGNIFVTGKFFPEYWNTTTKGNKYLDISKAAQEGEVTINGGNLLVLLMNTCIGPNMGSIRDEDWTG